MTTTSKLHEEWCRNTQRHLIGGVESKCLLSFENKVFDVIAAWSNTDNSISSCKSHFGLWTRTLKILPNIEYQSVKNYCYISEFHVLPNPLCMKDVTPSVKDLISFSTSLRRGKIYMLSLYLVSIYRYANPL